MIEMSDLLAAGPELFLAIMGMALMMIGVFTPEKKALDIVSGLTIFVLTITLAYFVFFAPHAKVVAFSGLFVTDAFAVFMKSLVLLGGVLVLIIIHVKA